MMAPMIAGSTQSIPIEANGKIFCSALISARMKEMFEMIGGNAANISKNAGIRVKIMVNRYTFLSLLNSGEHSARMINTIANGYRNINTGVDHVMISDSPSFAMINDTKQLNANHWWYEKRGKCSWKSWANAATRPTAVVTQVSVISVASKAWPVIPK